MKTKDQLKTDEREKTPFFFFFCLQVPLLFFFFFFFINQSCTLYCLRSNNVCNKQYFKKYWEFSNKFTKHFPSSVIGQKNGSPAPKLTLVWARRDAQTKHWLSFINNCMHYFIFIRTGEILSKKFCQIYNTCVRAIVVSVSFSFINLRFILVQKLLVNHHLVVKMFVNRFHGRLVNETQCFNSLLVFNSHETRM